MLQRWQGEIGADQVFRNRMLVGQRSMQHGCNVSDLMAGPIQPSVLLVLSWRLSQETHCNLCNLELKIYTIEIGVGQRCVHSSFGSNAHSNGVNMTEW